MKKISYLICILACLMLLTSCFRDPSNKKMNKETKKYLEHKYGEKFVVLDEIKKGTGNVVPFYYLTAYPSTNPFLKFRVTYTLSFFYSTFFDDEYDIEFLKEEGKKIYSAYFTDIYKGNYIFHPLIDKVSDIVKGIIVKNYKNWDIFLKSNERKNYTLGFGIEAIKTINNKTIKEVSENIYHTISKCKQDDRFPDSINYKFYHEKYTDPKSLNKYYQGSGYESTYYKLDFSFDKNSVVSSPSDVERIMRDKYPYLMNWTADCKIKDKYYKEIYDCIDYIDNTAWIIPTSSIRPGGQELILKNDDVIEISGLSIKIGEKENTFKNVDIELSDGKIHQYSLENSHVHEINFGTKYRTNVIKIRFNDYYQYSVDYPKNFVPINDIKIKN